MKTLKDYAHLYLGCKAIITNDDGEEEKRFLLNAYNLNYYRDYLSDIKLILRPLDSMTEEEKVEIAHILGSVDHLSVDAKIAQVTELMARFYNMQTNIPAVKWMHACRYFCSIGLDLFGLKDSGLAVYE